jgi:hypothetical protein
MKTPLLLLVIASLFSCAAEPAPASASATFPPSNTFPLSGGKDLSGAERQFPRDFIAKNTLVVVAFQSWQQDEVDVWFRALESQIKDDPDIEYFELPTLSPMGSLREWFLFKGMQSGIPDPWMRQRVVTLHLDKKAFNQSLDIPNEEHVSVFLVEKGGRIVGKVHGACNDKLLLQVKSLLQGVP